MVVMMTTRDSLQIVVITPIARIVITITTVATTTLTAIVAVIAHTTTLVFGLLIESASSVESQDVGQQNTLSKREMKPRNDSSHR
jgi:hypothetical protein